MLKFALVLLIVGAMLFAGCTIQIPVPDFTNVTGSGNHVTQAYSFSDFTGVSVGSAFTAEITRADGYLVEVTVDDNVVELLKVEQQGNTVYIDLKPNLSLNRTTLKARITLPTLTSLEASGAATAEISGFQSSQKLHVIVSGASRAEGDIQSGDLRADVSGGSTLRLTGSGGDADVSASGASTADLADFPVTNATVNASGASRISIDVSGVLRAEANGASSVHYTGSPAVERSDSSGASTISGR